MVADTGDTGLDALTGHLQVSQSQSAWVFFFAKCPITDTRKTPSLKTLT